MKKKLLRLLVGGSLLSLMFVSCNTTEKIEVPEENITASEEIESDKTEETSKGTDSISDYGYENVDITEQLDYLSTKISYPKFNSCPELNEKIKKTVEAGWKDFKSYAEKSWNDIKKVNSETSYPPFEYFVESKVSYSGNVISVYLRTYRFAGGAHGETFIKTFNYDSVSCRELDITEVSGYTYEELYDICRTELYHRLISADKFEITGETVNEITEMIEFGTQPMAGNYQRFTVDEGKLTIYFEQYSVAPYSYGVQSVETNCKQIYN